MYIACEYGGFEYAYHMQYGSGASMHSTCICKQRTVGVPGRVVLHHCARLELAARDLPAHGKLGHVICDRSERRMDDGVSERLCFQWRWQPHSGRS